MMTENSADIKIFNSPEEMSRAAAEAVLSIAADSVKERGRFVLSLSGGKTPEEVYRLLSAEPLRDKMSWKYCYVFWGDERYVPVTDERNNSHMARKALLDLVDIPASNIFPVPVNLSAADAAKQYEKTILEFFGNRDPRFDLVLLGLGENGHTASLFPRTDVLNEKVRLVKEVYVNEVQMYRITMTAPFINQARNIIFLVSGEPKAETLKNVLYGPFDPQKFPAQLIRPGEGKLTWYSDSSAASLLPGSYREHH